MQTSFAGYFLPLVDVTAVNVLEKQLSILNKLTCH